MRVPTMSDGIRSGVNWMRVNVPPSVFEQRRHGQRLAEAGHALEQAVAAGEEPDEHPLEHTFLADDDRAQLDEHLLEPCAGFAEGLGSQLGVTGIGHRERLRVQVGVHLECGHRTASTCSAIALMSAGVTKESPVTVMSRSPPSTHAYPSLRSFASCPAMSVTSPLRSS